MTRGIFRRAQRGNGVLIGTIWQDWIILFNILQNIRVVLQQPIAANSDTTRNSSICSDCKRSSAKFKLLLSLQLKYYSSIIGSRSHDRIVLALVASLCKNVNFRNQSLGYTAFRALTQLSHYTFVSFVTWHPVNVSAHAWRTTGRKFAVR